MRQRLLRAFGGLLVVVLGFMALIYGWSTRRALQTYEVSHVQAHVQLLQPLIELYYGRYQTLEGVERELIDSAVLLGTEVIITDPQSTIVLASTSTIRPGMDWVSDTAIPYQVSFTVFAEDGTTATGQVYLNQVADFAPIDTALRQSLTNSAIFAVGLALLIALGLTTYLSRTITQPLQDIDLAVQEIAGGQYAVRLAIPPTQDELAKLATSFNKMAEDLGKIEQLRRRLVADVSHDLNTPLAVLNGYVDGLLTGRIIDRASALDAFAAMKDELDYLTKLIVSLREASQWDQEKPILKKSRIDLREIGRSVVGRVAPLAEQNSIPLTTEFAHGDLTIDVDPTMMEQALYNLLVNAIQHNPPETAVSLKISLVPGGIETTITDNGRGIPPDAHGDIFERFHRLDLARGRKNGSIGLGLAIVKQVVIAHEGRIDLQSSGVSGEGSQFILFWPRSLPNL